MLVLDTDILIDVQRGHANALAWLGALQALPSLPGFVLMELIQDARDLREVRVAQRLVAPFPIIWPSESDCHRALADFAKYHLSHRLGLIDALIGACVLGRGDTLCTFNVKHYSVIRGLNTTQPYQK